nr:probable LRR receptor-like serine/threonine-protein kinase At1g56140 [Ipomoea trifida]
MGILGFSFFVLGLLNTVIAQSNITDPNEGFCSFSSLNESIWKIYGLDIVGEIPKELFVLKEMMDLSFGTNNLTGPIPPEIGNLSILITLSFATNNMNGPLPPELGNLTTLEEMYIDSNRFTGPIPEELSKLKNLRVLWASSNNFTGKLPELFGSLTDLAVLRLEGTLLEGPIPKSYGALTKLDDLRIGDINNADSSLDFIENVSSISILYLGSNNLSGELPANIITDTLFLNAVGTLITSKRSLRRSVCLAKNSVCTEKASSTSLSIKCGGNQIVTVDGIQFDDDSEMLGPASFYMSSNNQWAVSSSGIFINNPNGQNYTAHSFSQIPNTLDSELYKTARISPSSLRYYGVGLKKGIYRVELHFAEIQMDDIKDSWKGLGRRYFDVSIQGERVLRDFNVKQEAGGSKRALVKKFKANVTNNVLDIHFFWAGKGTCCIPVQSTFGPIVSAIHVTQEVNLDDSSDGSDKKRIGKIIGITLGSAAGVLIICTIFYVWWRKKKSPTYKGF